VGRLAVTSWRIFHERNEVTATRPARSITTRAIERTPLRGWNLGASLELQSRKHSLGQRQNPYWMVGWFQVLLRP